MRSQDEGPREPAGPAFKTLPVSARLLIGGTTAAGLLHLVWSSPSARFDSPYQFLGLLLASVALAASKVPLPLLPQSATLSLSYCTNSRLWRAAASRRRCRAAAP